MDRTAPATPGRGLLVMFGHCDPQRSQWPGQPESSFLLEAPLNCSFCFFLKRGMDVCTEATMRPSLTNVEYFVAIYLPLFILKDLND